MLNSDDFIDNISYVPPGSLANDENINLPLQELQNNIVFLSKLITVSTLNPKTLAFNKIVDEFNVDETGPRLTELQFTVATGAPSGTIPSTNVFEFDPGFSRYMSFSMPVDGPNPGNGFMGISFFVNENEFSDPITCGSSGTSGIPDTVCGYVKFSIYVAVMNSGEFGNPNQMTYNKYSYRVPIYQYMTQGKLGYFEVCGDFYKDLTNVQGSQAFFILGREGLDYTNDTFGGNFLISSVKMGLVSCFNTCSNIEQITC